MTTHKSPCVPGPEAASKKYRVNLSLPRDLAVMLNKTAKQMGTSQSALVTSLLVEALPALYELTAEPLDETSADSIKRFRGRSIDAIVGQLGKLLRALK